MSDGIAGGVYKDAAGKGYHNANGEAVTEDGKLITKAAEPETTGKKAK
jgi:hypothetical protein